MTDDLIALARTLAEGGHLPGIEWDDLVKGLYPTAKQTFTRPATEADIHFAAHNAIDQLGWIAVRNRKFMYLAIITGGCENEKKGSRFRFESHGTTTLSLLRAYAAALEAK